MPAPRLLSSAGVCTKWHPRLGHAVWGQDTELLTAGCLAVQNSLPFAVNLQLGGGFRQLAPAEQGAAVRPRQTQAYTWHVPASVGPGKQDFSTVAYTYRSTVDPTAHENAGLIGAIVVGRQVSSLFPTFAAENILR